MVDARSAAERESPPEPEHLVLAGEFPEVSEQEWVALVDGVLRRARRIPDGALVEVDGSAGTVTIIEL